jgi:hypothetical protein
VQVEGLEKCEALEKLDLTLNFVDLQNLPSIVALEANVHLKELYDNKSNSLSHYQCSTVHMVNACEILKEQLYIFAYCSNQFIAILFECSPWKM